MINAFGRLFHARGIYMKQVMLVALGGSFGAVTRFKLGGWVLHHYAMDWRFPAGTFVVNILGCFIAGVLSGLVERQHLFSADIRVLLFTGIMGGFTTFSAFGIESVTLLRRGETSVAIGYVVASVAVGLLLLWLG